jgi:hypothetical protein
MDVFISRLKKLKSTAHPDINVSVGLDKIIY